MTAPQALRAKAPLSMFYLDIALLVIAVASLVVSLSVDLLAHRADWFPRSGAVAALIAAILAYRSISRHYIKFFNNTARGYPLLTSMPQVVIDRATLALSLAGTAIWAYGDKWL